VSSSPERVTPPCPAHHACGGCPLANWAYAAQLKWKRELVAEAMAAQEVHAPVAACLPSPHPFGYRANAKVCLGHDRDGKLVLGAYAPRSHEIVDMSGCPVGEPALAEVAAALLTCSSNTRSRLSMKFVAPGFCGTYSCAPMPRASCWLRWSPDAKAGPRRRLWRASLPPPARGAGRVHNINSTRGNALFGEKEHLLFWLR